MSTHGGRWRDREGVPRCEYCGSISIAEATKRLSTPGTKFSGCDNKYGYPHKFYLGDAKFYTSHLEDATEEELVAFAALSRACLGVNFRRIGQKGTLSFAAPRSSSFYGWQTYGVIGADGKPVHDADAPPPPPEEWFATEPCEPTDHP